MVRNTINQPNNHEVINSSSFIYFCLKFNSLIIDSYLLLFSYSSLPNILLFLDAFK